jgi:hypothetical protein
MPRINPGIAQRERLLKANAHRCCVCKQPGLGIHLHHIDGDSSHTVDENIAVLCVSDHDRHHRPSAYQVRVNHLELTPERISQYKQSWEAFIAEARQPNPKVIATLAAYGTREVIHSLQLVMQWPDERIEYTRSYHLLEGNLDKMTDAVFDELRDIGTNMKLAMLDKPLSVEYCPCCGSGCSRTLKTGVVVRHTDPDWSTQSICSIYINPDSPSLAVPFFLHGQQACAGSLHLCQGKFLHYHSEGIDERLSVKPRPSIRGQAYRVVKNLLEDWSPAKVLIGTGNPDTPEIIDSLTLPRCWKTRA